MNPQSSLHLIPNVLAEKAIHALPSYLVEVVNSLRVFYVEEIKSARRLLRSLNKEFDIDACQFFILNEHHEEDLSKAISFFKQGISIGLISEAGCPNVADPGQNLVEFAHQHHVKIIPHIGPNSILMTLMASGFNGQHFQFHGYLPNKQPMLGQKIKDIETESRQKNCTQLFIETPYRNDQLLQELIRACHPETRLCIAANLTGENEIIISQSLKKWKNASHSFHKQAAVFALYAH